MLPEGSKDPSAVVPFTVDQHLEVCNILFILPEYRIIPSNLVLVDAAD